MLTNRARADELMDREGVSAIVATTPINVYYLSGWLTDASWHFGDLALVVLPRDHSLPAAIITAEADSKQMQQRDGPWIDIVRPYRRKQNMGPGGRPVTGDDLRPDAIPLDHIEAVAAYLEQIGLTDSKIAFEDRGLGYDVAEKLNRKLSVSQARDLMRDIRMVKTETEVRYMRAATRKTELGLLNAVEAVAGGATCAEAERAYWTTVPALGGRPVFLLITPFRPGYGKLKKSDRLQPGDMVTFDTTAEFEHYTSDVGRTACIGMPTAEMLRRYNAMRRGWTNSLIEFKPGVDSAALERKVASNIREAGMPDFAGVSIHSVGLEHTDHPHPANSLAPFTLVAGSMLSCDTAWLHNDVGKFHLEDLVYLHPDGRVELLNDPDTRMFACIDGRTERVE